MQVNHEGDDNVNDLISVIVPAYNMENYIEQCLDSIIAQTYTNIEIIVVDDGSSDSTGKICDLYAEKDARFVIVHQENQGLVKARKKGLSVANGKYVGFVDSDDWIDREMYEFLYKNLLETKAQVVTTGRFLEEDKTYILEDYMPGGIYHPQEDEFFCSHMIFGEDKKIWGITPNFWNKLFEKELLMKYEEMVDDQITYGEDDACVYPCMAFAKTVSVTDGCFYHYRMRMSSMSNSEDENYLTRVNLLYLCLKRSFEKHPLAEVLIKELDLYMFEFVWRGMNGLWGIKPGIKIPHKLMDMSCLIGKRKIVLYGAAKAGQNYYQQLKLCGIHNKVIWVDREYRKFQRAGLPVYGIDWIEKNSCDLIIIAAIKRETYESIKKDLLKIGMKPEKICWNHPKDILTCID